MAKFVAGARVAKVSGFHGHYHIEAFIKTIHKNGNFTLVGDETNQQWKPTYNNTVAYQTNDHSSFRTKVVIWDEGFDQWLAIKAAERAHHEKANAVSDKMNALICRGLKFVLASDLAELDALLSRIAQE
jgi:hypothetical protein